MLIVCTAQPIWGSNLLRRNLLAGVSAIAIARVFHPVISASLPPKITKFAVVYGEQSKIIHRIVELDPPETDQFLYGSVTDGVGPGQAIALLNLADYPILRRVVDVQPAIGVPTCSGRCALVDAAGFVVNTIMADPYLYSHPTLRTVWSNMLNIGDSVEIA